MHAVADYLSHNQPRFLNELFAYLRFPSVSAQSQHQADMLNCAEWIADHVRHFGLTSEVCPTDGHPIVVARTPRQRGRSKPHYIVYGHYDVQPPEPFELWESPPFEPRIAGRSIYARGSADNKGQHFAHLKAIEAFLRTGTDLPCDLTFLIEGEEEVGSSHLAPFLAARKKEFACEGIVISDTGMPDRKLPALTCGLRGIIAFEITLTGPARDLHSGVFGGALDNPGMALCQLLAQCRDDQGRVAIPGFYEDVRALSDYERQQFARLPMTDAKLKKLLGVPELFGEKGFLSSERTGARPTFEINGLTAGYQGEGSKTVIGAWARAKITCRLVPDQKPERIRKLVQDHLRKLCPPTVRLKVTAGHGAEAYLVDPAGPQAQAALRALKSAFGNDPVLLREGGSIPIVNQMKRILGADSLLLGLALPDADAHSPNEKFDLDCFAKGQLMSACLWHELAAL